MAVIEAGRVRNVHPHVSLFQRRVRPLVALNKERDDDEASCPGVVTARRVPRESADNRETPKKRDGGRTKSGPTIGGDGEP